VPERCIPAMQIGNSLLSPALTFSGKILRIILKQAESHQQEGRCATRTCYWTRHYSEAWSVLDHWEPRVYLEEPNSPWW